MKKPTIKEIMIGAAACKLNCSEIRLSDLSVKQLREILKGDDAK